MRQSAPTAQKSEVKRKVDAIHGGDVGFIEYLKAQIEREREQADARIGEALERERRERERAARLEMELAELRKDHESVMRLLTAPKEEPTPPKPGFLSRMFGRGN